MMKKIIFLGFLLMACSKLEFRYDSVVDYASYKKAYVLEIYNQVPSMNYSEQDMMNVFCEVLNKKSGFTKIYNFFDHPQLADSVLPAEYLVLRLTVEEGEYKYQNIEHDNGDVTFYYEATITVKCEALSSSNLVFQVSKSAEYNQEYDSDSDNNFYEVKNTALVKALEEVAKYFTKSYVI
jgi:hypothetical protein